MSSCVLIALVANSEMKWRERLDCYFYKKNCNPVSTDNMRTLKIGMKLQQEIYIYKQGRTFIVENVR